MGIPLEDNAELEQLPSLYKQKPMDYDKNGKLESKNSRPDAFNIIVKEEPTEENDISLENEIDMQSQNTEAYEHNLESEIRKPSRNCGK